MHGPPGIVAFTLSAVLFIAPCARAQDTPPAGPESDGDNEQATSSGTPPPPAPVLTPPVALDQPFKRLLPNFWHDLTHFPSLDTAVVIGIGAVFAGAAVNYDEKWTLHASAGGEDPAYTAGGAWGSGFTQFGIAVGTYAIGRVAHHEKAAHVGSDLIRSQLLSGVITHSIKLATQRARPTGEQDSSTDTHSFPSGHASSSWTTATVLWRHLGWKVGVPASVLASFASASRLQQNAHYASDILFGAAIGVASGRTVTFGHGERRIVVAPTPVAGGGAIMCTLVDGR